MGKIASQMVRLNRKLAWVLVAATILVLVTGYAQSMSAFNRRSVRDLHRIVEWIFIAILIYHVLVGTLLAKYRYRSTLGRMLKGRISPASALRFVLRVSSWPLLLLSAIVVLSGLSWRGRFPGLPFNSHVQIDILFVLVFAIHVAVGGAIALKRNWPRRGGDSSRDSLGGERGRAEAESG